MDIVVASRAAKVRQQRALIEAITGTEATTNTTEARRPIRPIRGLDGGARSWPLRPPISHDDWLIDVLRRRLADQGASF